MRMNGNGRLRRAIYLAFAAGAAGVAVTGAPAFAEQATTELQGVEITGSHIRRVDAETADPIVTLDSAYIKNTGAATIGELISQLSNVAGQGFTPQVNNGGNGETNPGLRGLTAARTLLLLDGQRLLTDNIDAIPVNMVERVEIVKDGASAVYGSDAVGGVINIITRKHFTGFEATAEFGTSNRTDGTRQQYTGTWGMSSSKGHVVFGASYTNQDQILTGDRGFSKVALAQYYNGAAIALGSGTPTTGRYRIPTSVAQSFGYNCTTKANTTLSRNPGASGANPSTDFHCTNGSDTYNYDGVNLLMTPSQRTELFGIADYKILDNISFVARAFYHNQQANNQLAPEPLVTASDGITVSKNNYYNPFGVDITNARLRLATVGDRKQTFDTNDYDITTGLKGDLLDRFQWDTLFTYQRETTLSQFTGQVYIPGVQQAVGPSIDQNTCGTPGSPIAGCVPFDIFGVPTGAQLSPSLFPTDFTNTVQQQHILNADISGDLLTLPAGAFGVAVGYEYRDLTLNFAPDGLVGTGSVTDYQFQATQGFIHSNEIYAEGTIPVLAKLPGAYSLTVDLGGRFSDYSTFGTTTNGKYGIEYRPIHDLLIRGSYADVFRVPTISDLYAGASQNAAPVNDPCNGTGANGQASNPACKGVDYSGGSFTDAFNQVTVNDVSNPNLKPETGYTTSFGMIYNPSFYTPLSVNFDYWTYSLTKAISTVSLQQSLDLCYAGNTQYCSNFNRVPGGDLNGGIEPKANVGHLLTSGFDFGTKLDLPHTRIGGVTLSLDGTYLQKYKFQATPTSSTVSLAGLFLPGTVTDQDGTGNFARVRILSSASWKMDDFTVTLINRYISNVNEFPAFNANGGSAASFCPNSGTKGGPETIPVDPTGTGTGNTGGYVVCKRSVGDADYVDLTASYTYKPAKTTLLVGVNNVTDKNAPIVFSGFNANTDVSTYDTVGRYFFARLTTTFK